ncbi:hypothetical protein [Paenibacillus thermotolerans]|uniref:hypothetical protein n=1 Tax=Paenibacillus thermotolerans TaxID=3027807 RepID=UPI002367595A|nr:MULTISPECIES: hypothetical protein [unclassified Paenibacillus]
MAKSVKEKLASMLDVALELAEEAVIGDQEGQYPQEAADAFKTGLDFAGPVAQSEDATDEQRSEALNVLSDAVKAFKASAVKPAKETATVAVKGVELKDWPEGQEGNHSVFLKGGRIVSFKNGKADVPSELADELEKAGFVE